MFDPENLVLNFEWELYVDFHKNYKKVNPYFYYFELVKGFIGFSFAFEIDAQILYTKINSTSPKKSL